MPVRKTWGPVSVRIFSERESVLIDSLQSFLREKKHKYLML